MTALAPTTRVAEEASPPLLPPHLAASGAKGRLFAAAVVLFSARGYHGVSVRDLTAHLGVKPSSLYALFPSKADLFAELVFLANEEIRERVRAALLDAGSRPEDQLRAVVSTFVEFHTTYPLLATLSHNDLYVLSGRSLDRVAASRKDAVELLRSVIVRGNDLGVFDCADPWIAVASIAAMGIRVTSWYLPPGHEGEGIRGIVGEVRTWIGSERSVDDVKDTLSDYALRIVGYGAAAGREAAR
jgi:AcrR family transcriptional regulator